MFRVKSYSKEETKSPSKLFLLLRKSFLIIFTIFLSNFIFNIYFYKSDIKNAVFINPIAKEILHGTTTFINSMQNSKSLENIVLNILKEDKGNYGVVIFNLETGERYYLNEEKEFDTASLYKLWVMAVSFEQIEQGNLKDTEVLSDSISAIDNKFNLSTDSQEVGDNLISWPVRNALENMIIISDNYSAYLLTERIGIDKISNFLSSRGFSDSKVGGNNLAPQTSASDMAIFLERLYDGKFANTSDTSRMIELLKSQKVSTKLAKYLPADAVVAHKTGELGSFSHDVGIVYLKKGNYIIVALSSTKDQLGANEKIAQVSKGVYNYFSNK